MSAPMAIRTCVIGVAVTLTFVLAGSPANAQKTPGPPNALQGFSQNRDEPIKINAASLEVRDKEQQATFSGDVHVVQGDTEMRCKSLIIFYDEDPGARGAKAADPLTNSQRQVRRIEAKGGVAVTQKDQNAVGDNATFDLRANVVTLVGNVVVTRGSDVLRGQRLMVDLTNGVSKMDAGRVEGLFHRPPDAQGSTPRRDAGTFGLPLR
jgi:lipopolysaccharide export system protein LptA